MPSSLSYFRLMRRWSKRKKILLGLLLLFVAAQAVRPPKNIGKPSGTSDIATVVTVPDDVMAVLKKSCYDCHSDYSNYPWYDEITPVNWWVAHHIKEGKRELNFTQFGSYSARKKNHKLEEIAETVEKGSMPLKSYLVMHGDAKLTDAQRRAVITWANESRRRVLP